MRSLNVAACRRAVRCLLVTGLAAALAWASIPATVQAQVSGEAKLAARASVGIFHFISVWALVKTEGPNSMQAR
jgi:hypothetical protein